MLVKCSTKLYTFPRGRHHSLCEDAPPAEGPNVELEELPKASCAGAAALLIAAALTFLPVRPMPPLSRGIKRNRQTSNNNQVQSLLAATPHMDMGQGLGRSQARASELQWHSMYLCGCQR
jgi:hypothetical protein